MDVYLRFGRLGTFDVAVRTLQREIFCGVPGDAAAVRIKARLVEVIPVLVWFAPSKNTAFHFDISPDQTSSGHPEGDVRGVLPVVTNWRIGIVHRRWEIHERGRAECWFARITEIDISAEIVTHLLRQAQ